MEPRFRRGELERALWAFKANKKHAPPLPSEFATRIRRLLEIDRASNDFVEAGEAYYAFSEDGPGGKGHDAVFSLLDLQMLWLGLELIEMGFKQREVVEQLRFARPLLSRTLGGDLNSLAPSARPHFLALPGVERSQHDWLRPPRPFLIDADELAQRASEGKLNKIVLLPVGWRAFRVEETLALAPPSKRRQRKTTERR
ncbi:MAG: hypothetical protein ACREH4_03870 [Vitreimonas sp.]